MPGVYTVTVTDSSTPVLSSSAQVISSPDVSFAVSNVILQVNDSYDFTTYISGGSGNPANYQLSASSGVVSGLNFTAPATAGVVTVTVKDISYNPPSVAQATVVVNEALSISPTTLSLAVNNKNGFAASGGVPPYTFSLQSGSGQITSTGSYTAPSTVGSDVIKVTDSRNHSVTSTVTIAEGLTIAPSLLTLETTKSYQFTSSGGVGNKIYSLVSGIGVLTASGNYQAPATEGAALVEVCDSLGNKSQAIVNIVPPISISPNPVSIVKNSTLTFKAQGGVPPYSYSLEEGSIAGSVSSAGAYSASSEPGLYHLKVTDSQGNSTTSAVTVFDSLLLSPFNATTVTGQSISFTVSGGVAPYTYKVVESGGGSITNEGVYTASGATGTYQVQVTDKEGQTSTSTVTVNAPLSVASSTITLGVNDLYSVQALNGVPPYIYSVITANGGTINESGLYQAPAAAGTYTLQVQDSLNNTVTFSAVVKPALSLAVTSPTTSSYVKIGQSKTLTISGGVSPYSSTVVEGIGTLTPSGLTLSYAAPANLSQGSVATILVTDALGHQAQLALSIYDDLQISPSSVTLAINNTKAFSKTGGVAPFTWSVSVGAGTISNLGIYTASGTPNSYTVTVTDSDGNQSTSNVTVNAGISVSPSSASLALNDTQVFTITGGSGSYSYLLMGVGQFDESTKTYTATRSGSAIIQVTDTANNQVSINISIALPAAPTGLSLVTPATIPSNNPDPVVNVTGVSNGDTVSVYKNSACTQLIGTANATAGNVNVSLSLAGLTDGTYSFYAQRTTSAGDTSSCSTANVAYQLDTAVPTITSVTSSTADGTYKEGNALSIQVQFSENVTVTGTPTLDLNTGRSGAYASYASGSGTNTLSFSYTVTSGDNSADLDYTGVAALLLNGGSLTDAAGNTLSAGALLTALPLPASTGSLSANKNIVLDTTPPAAPSALNLNTPSTSPGSNTTPILQVSGVVSGDLVKLFTDNTCSTQVASGTATGTSILLTTSSLSAGSYTFYANSADAVGNVSTCSTANASYTLDLTAPTVTTVTSSGNGPFKAGDSFTISIQFSEVVNVTGTPVLALNTGRSGAQATYSSGTGNNTLTFTYTVVATDNASDLSYTDTTSLGLNGGTIEDNSGNDSVLTLPGVGLAGSLSINQQIVIDTTAPTTPTTLADGNYMNSTSTSPAITFTSGTDVGGTGIQKHQLRIIRASDSFVMADWTDFSSGNSVISLSLVDGTLYKAQIKSIDNVSNESSTATSDGWTPDATAPTNPSNLTLGSVPSNLTTSPTLSWTASTDAVSGVSHYEAQIHLASDNSIVKPYATLTSGSSFGSLSLTNNAQYYFSLRAIDTAGNVGTVVTSSNWTARLPGKQVFSYTGSNQTFTVPAGVNSITVKAWGAGGGGASGKGGGGGYATQVIAVTSGESLTVIVGQGGTNSITVALGATFGGGGATSNPTNGRSAGQGGGRSAVRRNSTELITAGGGGGGTGAANSPFSRNGGAGGGSSGATGVGGSIYGGSYGGGGGTQSAGGTGGTGGYNTGTSGSAFTGGKGCAGYYYTTQAYYHSGGGGGGGYYGGGGGGCDTAFSSGSGGGGSSYAPTGSTTSGSADAAGNTGDSDYVAGIGTGASGSNGAVGGNGRVVISW